MAPDTTLFFQAGDFIISSPSKFELQNFEICLVCVASAWMEVVGAGKNGRARGRHACLLLARPFFFAPTTSKRVLRRLKYAQTNHLQTVTPAGCLK